MNDAAPIRIMIADDHTVVRQGLSALITNCNYWLIQIQQPADLEANGRHTEMMATEVIPAIQQSTTTHARVVLAGTDFKSREVLIDLLRQKGLEILLSSSLTETRSLLAHEDTALVICHATSSNGDFRRILRSVVGNGSKVPVIVCTDFYEPRLYLEAMELGAFDYFAYPYYRDGVEWVVSNALQEVLNNGGMCCEGRAASESVSC